MALAARAAAAAPGFEFRVLSYNTHGLPAYAALDDPARRFPIIGGKARAYDVALLQENFRWNAELVAGGGPWTVEQGNASRFAGTALCALLCDGAGLTLATTLAREALLGLTSRPYEACSGWILGANDCLATKGFVHARILLGGEYEVHFVNTHLDAGRSPEDRAARRAELAQLRAYLEREAATAPIVLGGDLNLDAANAEDIAIRDEFAAALGLHDTGAGAAPGGAWTKLDYLYWRDGSAVLLEVVEAGEAREFVDDADAPLSDHPAIYARLRARPLF
ncbi:MAG TPA: endonuclease/exonuclease/phosphatase family protein [Myxococcota bacterium]|nr:endonuclease/exonuclease/phosphatase family protein [Myxococcota bacterium]